MARVLITGGCGYVGQWLARLLAERGELSGPGGAEPVDSITLFDIAEPAHWVPEVEARFEVVSGDLAAGDWPEGEFGSVFHLASIVSGEGETDFDKAMRINFDGNRHVLERLRGTSSRLVFASTIAVFGQLEDSEVPQGDFTKQMPKTTYGTTKAITELLINDYSRKGFLDGRSARLPTVIVRAGAPNKAASSFCSGVIREPLNGIDAQLPVPRSQPLPVTSYRAVCAGLIGVHELQAEQLGFDRAVGLPALNVTAGDLADCTERLAENRPGMGQVVEEIDPFIAGICAGWPTAIDNSRAIDLGLPMPPDLDAIAAEYIADYSC